MYPPKMHRTERSTVVEGSCPQRRRTPSFSSSLLDTIYRSFDESKSHLDEDQQHLGRYNSDPTHNTNAKHTTFSHNNTNHGVHNSEKGTKERMNLRRAVMIEDWMEKQSSQSFMNSSSSSSECSSGGVFSSSETDTTCKMQRSRSETNKPLKQNVNPNSERSQQKKKSQRESGFTRTKLRALKIYGELNQRVKQPISPGSRIASFLSSIFSSENVKKAKMCYVGAVEDVSFEHKPKSPCFSSSASSFSRRSCMSKTPNNKSNNGPKRSVRFYPDNVILGEDYSPQLCGIKYVCEDEPTLMQFRKTTRNSSSIKEMKNNEDVAAARGFMKVFQNSGKFDFRGYYDNGELDDDDDDEEEDDDGGLSCSSSDLFELDHLNGAGIRYQEELPVYETTNLETNKAIANGFRF